MRFTDSHCHLADQAFDGDRDEVIERAFAAGAVALVCVGESLEKADASRLIAAAYPGRIAWTAGIHPHDATGFDPARDVAAIRAMLDAGACAIGECGLDAHYDHSPPDLQRRAFAAQLELAHAARKPVVVHTREAADDTAAMIREAASAGVRGVLHCFTGPASLMEAALAAGWYISFSGIVTFSKWAGDALVRQVPDERLLVESDAPYLAPIPKRGKRNEPAFVVHTVARVAAVRGVEPDLVANLASRNAEALFGL
ncbi:MAG: TatD family hydrolase [Gemmatimonadaceae bacterium]|nr:TatD family hydrolase [Gemmatimonadaceae bacterium]